MSTKLEELTLKEKIGQMFIIGLNSNTIDDKFKTMLQEYKIGGVILYRKNYNSYEEMLDIINQIKKCNQNNKIPLFIATDQEGGRCNRMPKEFYNLLSPTSITRKEDITLVERASKITATMLKQSGFNLNFAPVLDIKRFPDDHAIGNRSYGETEDAVSKYGIRAMKTMQEEGILPVVKHFPGHGATTTDSHMFLPVVKNSLNFLEEHDIVPFQKAIQEGADAIMVGHLVVKELSSIYPASLSKKCIIGYLRNKLDYKGLIMTDDLKMKAVQFVYGPTHATKLAFRAGNDIIINRANYSSIIKTIQYVERIAKKDEKVLNHIHDSVSRILQAKEKYNVTDELIETMDINKINQEIEEINSTVKSKE